MLTPNQLNELDKLMSIYKGLHYGSNLQGTIQGCRWHAHDLRYHVHVWRTKHVFDKQDKPHLKLLTFKDRVDYLKEAAQLNRLAILLEMQFGHLF